MIGEYAAYEVGKRVGRNEQSPKKPSRPTPKEAAMGRALGWLLLICTIIAAVVGSH